jgi:hypothetical protein
VAIRAPQFWQKEKPSGVNPPQEGHGSLGEAAGPLDAGGISTATGDGRPFSIVAVAEAGRGAICMVLRGSTLGSLPPQRLQKFMCGAFWRPQTGHAIAAPAPPRDVLTRTVGLVMRAPHSSQNRAPSRFCVSHFRQRGMCAASW